MTKNLELLKKITFVDFATDYAVGGYLYPPRFIWYSAREPKKIKSWIGRALNESSFKFAIYAHFPFCISRCAFCRFYSLANKNPADYDEVLDFMTKELGIWAGLIRRSKKIKGKIPLESIYLGGGTPTLFNLGRFFNALLKDFDISHCNQINLESTPDALNEEKLRLYKKIGISRLLIGIQSLDSKVLGTVNRSTGQSFILEKKYRLARRIGIPNITFELIAGLPDQSKESFIADLRRLIKLKPDGIHIYRFMRSPLSILGKTGYRHTVASRLVSRESYRAGWRELKGAGYTEKGDEWILRGKEGARNFQLAFSRPNLITIGPSASGNIRTDNYTFYILNAPAIKEYQRHINANNLATKKYFILKGKEELARQVLINRMRFRHIVDWSDFKKFGRELEFLKKHGIVKVTDSGMRIYYGENLFYPRIFYSPKILKRCKNIIETKYKNLCAKSYPLI